VVESVFSRFTTFLKETNAIALAMAVVIGGAVQKLVSSLVNGIFMPLIGMILPDGSWRTWTVHLRGENALAIGDVIGATMDFLIVAVVLYVVVSKLLRVAPAK
jgi:large conductance mechanosensitive channel